MKKAERGRNMNIISMKSIMKRVNLSNKINIHTLSLITKMIQTNMIIGMPIRIKINNLSMITINPGIKRMILLRKEHGSHPEKVISPREKTIGSLLVKNIGNHLEKIIDSLLVKIIDNHLSKIINSHLKIGKDYNKEDIVTYLTNNLLE